MRSWVYQTLKLSGIWTPLEGRLYGTSRMTQIPPEKLHAFIRMGVSSGMLHTDAPVVSTPFQLFIQDEPGDYLRLDELHQLAKDELTQEPPTIIAQYGGEKLIRCEWLELSGDIPEDPATGTISKFARYRLVHLP